MNCVHVGLFLECFRDARRCVSTVEDVALFGDCDWLAQRGSTGLYLMSCLSSLVYCKTNIVEWVRFTPAVSFCSVVVLLNATPHIQHSMSQILVFTLFQNVQ